MNKRISRRSYSNEFKLEAVRLVNQTDQTKAQIARELDISYTLLNSWCRSFRDLGNTAFQKTVGLSEEQQEIKRLRLEVKELKEDREILKKAAAYFAKELK